MQMMKRLFTPDEDEISPRLSHHAFYFSRYSFKATFLRRLLFAQQFYKSAWKDKKTVPLDEHVFPAFIDDQNSSFIIFLPELSCNSSGTY